MQLLSHPVSCLLKLFSRKYFNHSTTLARTPGAYGPGGPSGLNGAPGMSTYSSDEHPDLSHLYNVNLISRATCAYLWISTSVVPLNTLCLWPKMLCRWDVVEADGQQDSVKLHHLNTCTEIQAHEVQALHNKVTWL